MIRSVTSSITKKSLLLFSTILIIPVLMIYNLIIGYAHRVLEEDIVKKNLLSADALSKRINAEISDVVLQLQLIAEPGEEDGVNPRKMYERAKKTIASSSMIHTIYMADLGKRLLFEAPFDPQPEPVVHDYPNFDVVRWSYTYAVSDMQRNYRGVEVVSVSIPVLDKNDQVSGVMVAELSEEYLSEVLRVNSTANNGFSFIIDRFGKIIASTDPTESGLNIASHPVALNMSRFTSGSMKSVYHGESSILAYKTMWDGWGLIIGVPERFAFQPVASLSVALRVSFFAILFLSLLFIGLGVRKILYPIVRLTQFARNFDKENSIEILYKLKIKTKDELAILWKTMTAMALSIREKQNMLEEKERYLLDVIEGIPYAILTVDIQGKVTHVNRQFEQITGFRREFVLGKPLSDIPIKNSESDFVLWNTLQSDQTSPKETYIIDSDNRKHAVNIVTSKIYNEQRQVIGTIAVIQDITEFKLLEKQAKQSEKLALIGQITTGIAHEIKNPLAILSGASELLKEEVESESRGESVDELVDDIYKVVRRMNGIVNNFLSFAKMKNESEEEIFMDKLLDEVLHHLRIKLRDAKVEVVKAYEANSFTLTGKYNKLMQVFLNLLLNSIEAMPSGGTLTIRMYDDPACDGSSLVVEITDTGIGVSDQTLEWLFDPFFTTKESGSGLGLTIARDIVAEHGGELQIESRLGRGTSIKCVFPLHAGGLQS